MTVQSHEAINAREATGLHLRQLFNLLRRRWKLIMTAAWIAVGLAGALGLGFPPRYTATAAVIVDPPKASSGAGEPSIAGVLDDPGVQTHVAALLSQSHLQGVFDSLVAERGPEPKERRNVLGVEEFSIDTFKNRISAFKDSHSRMVGITYVSTDPAFAAAVANRSMDRYLATLRDRDLTDRKDALRSLRERIPLVRAELVRADAALQSYRIRHGFSEANGMDMVDQQLVDLNRQLAVARSELAERQTRPTPSSIDQTTNQSEMAQESSTLATRVRQLERRIAVLRDASSEMRESEAQLSEMQREATALGQLYESLVQRRKSILEETNVQPDVRVLSLASIPTLPSSLNPLLFIPPAIVLALIGSGLLAVLLEQLDGTLRTEREVTDALGISCVGTIPQLTGKRKRWFRRDSSRKSTTFRPHQLIPQDARYTEAIRSVVAAALQLANPQRSPKTLLVTSSVTGEGKTTLAISFAAYAARIQCRVLLIDLSFRAPSIASELSEPAEGGILQIRQGRPLTELIRAAPGLGFDYLPLSRDSADPVATLASEQVPELLRQLEGSYDCVVIDSAPILSATETRLLASMVDKVLFAVKWGSTRREVAQNALELLRRSAFGGHDQRVAIAAVITQVDLKLHARYRYGDFSENLFHVNPYPA
jgi:polysaccharide biosynthesis transport protein